METIYTSERVKALFYQQYQNTYQCFEGISNSLWSVDVDVIKGYYINNGDRGRIYMKDVSPLELKSLDNISDEDAYEMALFNRDLGDNKYRKDLIEHSKKNIFYHDAIGSLRAHHHDFLRMKGYAVPYLLHSVKDLIELGWIVLKK